jgi:hypothetical protein
MPRRDRVGVVLGAAALATPFLVGWSQASGEPDTGRTVLRFADHRVVESSGLVQTDGWVVTVNDSGDRGRVFTVDPDTGETVGVTTWPEDPVDVEALAPAGAGHVWVGDIGDNTRARDSITVRRVPVGPGDRTAEAAPVELTYPDGTARDAEALLAHPRTGRLYVVTKGVLAGEVHAAPARPGPGPGTLRQVGRVGGIVTDGAFLPDGRHLVLRTYRRAVVHAFPSLEPVGAWDLPEQPQGEGLAVASDGSLLLSSEGQDAEVLRVDVPADVRHRMGRGTAEPVGDGERADARVPSLWQLLASLFDRRTDHP